MAPPVPLRSTFAHVVTMSGTRRTISHEANRRFFDDKMDTSTRERQPQGSNRLVPVIVASGCGGREEERGEGVWREGSNLVRCQTPEGSNFWASAPPRPCPDDKSPPALCVCTGGTKNQAIHVLNVFTTQVPFPKEPPLKPHQLHTKSKQELLVKPTRNTSTLVGGGHPAHRSRCSR